MTQGHGISCIAVDKHHDVLAYAEKVSGSMLQCAKFHSLQRCEHALCTRTRHCRKYSWCIAHSNMFISSSCCQEIG